ncbi:hypothetical protein [Clostridium sp. Cult2]|uniref:hypothetical protein n=1 Tax=Clostridium sp. Cult2 TaxID=2079003 RepID=UPI001F47378E|nr:hypothetical protein [Clostridium sp. Cult2]MCF6464887.1 hypothetical protein [Clostridium sp. Cult2]
MQKRRVGTISMALVLIAFGVLIFISQINKVSAVELGLKFWPAILFLIGGEILWYSYRYKEEDIKIKYDVFSIFIVLIIVGINLAIYGLIETGMMDRLNTMVSSQNFSYQIPFNEVEVDDDIQKIVINAPNYSGLTLRTEKNNKIGFTGSLDITTDREDKAKELLKDEYIMSNKSGDTLYISFADRSFNNNGPYNVHPYDFSLIIPEDREVEINGGNDLQLIADSINKDWIIDNVNRTKIRLGKDMDLKITASVVSQEMLGGNVKWNITENNNEELSNAKGELVYGDGNNKINILNSDEVVVDELE